MHDWSFHFYSSVVFELPECRQHWGVGGLLTFTHSSHTPNQFHLGEVYNFNYLKFFPPLPSQHGNIISFQQMKSVLRYAADAFKMTIFFLSSTLLSLRAATSFPIGKAILSSQNAFSNETAISSYIKELKAKVCTLQFQNKNPIV